MFTCSNEFEVIYGYNLALFLKIILIDMEKMGSEEISGLTLVTAIINNKIINNKRIKCRKKQKKSLINE